MNLVKNYLLIAIIISNLFTGLSHANPAIDAYEDENYKLAKELFEKDKDTSISKLYLGRLEMKEGNFDEAEELIKAALDMEQSNSNYHYWFASISGIQAGNASIFSAPGYASDSKNHFIKAVELDPKNVQALQGLISFYTQAPSIVGGSIEKAKKLSITLTSLDKKEGLSAQIDLHNKEGETEQALEKSVQLATDFATSPEALLKAGFVHQTAEKYEIAFQYFTRASLIEESALDASLNKKQKRDKQTAATSALYQVGRNAVLSGLNLDQGIIALENYLKLEPNRGQPSLNWAKIRLAALYVKKGNKVKAKELALVAVKDKTDNGPRKIAKKLLKKIGKM